MQEEATWWSPKRTTPPRGGAHTRALMCGRKAAGVAGLFWKRQLLFYLRFFFFLLASGREKRKGEKKTTPKHLHFAICIQQGSCNSGAPRGQGFLKRARYSPAQPHHQSPPPPPTLAFSHPSPHERLKEFEWDFLGANFIKRDLSGGGGKGASRLLRPKVLHFTLICTICRGEGAVVWNGNGGWDKKAWNYCHVIGEGWRGFEDGREPYWICPVCAELRRRCRESPPRRMDVVWHLRAGRARRRLKPASNGTALATNHDVSQETKVWQCIWRVVGEIVFLRAEDGEHNAKCMGGGVGGGGVRADRSSRCFLKSRFFREKEKKIPYRWWF